MTFFWMTSCRSMSIKGSDDASIKNIVPNDIMPIINASHIERILCNGTRSWDTYMKYIYPQTGIEAVKMPSTSPANAAWSLERLVQAWGPSFVLRLVEMSNSYALATALRHINKCGGFPHLLEFICIFDFCFTSFFPVC